MYVLLVVLNMFKSNHFISLCGLHLKRIVKQNKIICALDAPPPYYSKQDISFSDISKQVHPCVETEDWEGKPGERSLLP